MRSPSSADPSGPGHREAVVVDLDDEDPDTPGEVLALVDSLRARVAGGERLRVRNCPQMVAHTLYKAGLLLDGRIELESSRQEEPFG
jgi:hypothetical protein